MPGLPGQSRRCTTRAAVPPQSGARGTTTALRGPEPCRSPVRRLNLPSAQPRTATLNSRRLPARAVQAGARRWRAAGTHGRSALRRLLGLAQRVLGCIRAGASCEASQAMDSERIALYQCIVRCVPSAPPATRPRTRCWDASPRPLCWAGRPAISLGHRSTEPQRCRRLRVRLRLRLRLRPRPRWLVRTERASRVAAVRLLLTTAPAVRARAQPTGGRWLPRRRCGGRTDDDDTYASRACVCFCGAVRLLRERPRLARRLLSRAVGV